MGCPDIVNAPLAISLPLDRGVGIFTKFC